jgi:hypothetical protein
VATGEEVAALERLPLFDPSHVAERTTPPGALLDGRLEAFEKAYGLLTILTGHLHLPS